MKRRTLVSALPALVLGASVKAQDAAAGRRYVVVSLIGDEMTNNAPKSNGTGSMITRGAHKAVPMEGAPFDKIAAQAIAGVAPRADAGAQVGILDASGLGLYSAQEGWFDDDKVTLPPALADAVARQGATRLLLLTKIKRDGRATNGAVFVPTGPLMGLGVYRDNGVRIHNNDDNQDYGLVAPYVFARLSVIDVATSRQLRHRDIEKTRSVFVTSPGDLLAALQQVMVDNLIQSANEVVPGG
jgi:hypothetical protein